MLISNDSWIRIGPAGRALVDSVAEALSIPGADIVVTELSARLPRPIADERGLLVPFTELVLLEVLRIAEAPGWTWTMRLRQVRAALDLAGFTGEQS